MPHVNRIKILKLLIILIYVVKGWFRLQKYIPKYIRCQNLLNKSF